MFTNQAATDHAYQVLDEGIEAPDSSEIDGGSSAHQQRRLALAGEISASIATTKPLFPRID